MAELTESIDNSGAALTQRSSAKTVGLLMFGLLLVSYVLMAADRYLFPVLAADIRRTFGFSLQNTGLLATVFTLGLGVSGLPTGYLLARYSRKSILLLGVVIFSAATALATVASGFVTMLICLAVQGAGMSMLATSLFALAANYFAAHRAAAVGAVNFCYGLGGIIGPILAAELRTSYGTWQVPMVAFGVFGLVIALFILVLVKPWFSETQHATKAADAKGGAITLNNRNTIILTVLSVFYGLSVYGFLGLYPTFLRENSHYTPAQAGTVISFFGFGSLLSIFGGWLGDRFSPKIVLSVCNIIVAVLGYMFFMPDLSMMEREALTFCYGIFGSSVLYVNLAGYHMKSLRRDLSGRGSGMFITSLYAGGAFGGYVLGSLASNFNWMTGSELQISALGIIGAVLALAVRRNQMSS